MFRTAHRVLALALMLAAVVGCATKPNVGHQIAANKEGLPKLTVGMTKAQVMSTMGELQITTNEGVAKNPFMIETVTGRDGAKYEVLYYVTRIPPPYTPIGKFITTPVILKGGKYVGQSWETLEKIEPPKKKK